MLKDSSLQHFSLRVSLLLKLSHLSNALPVFSYDAIIGHLRVPAGLCFKTRVGSQPLMWKSFFILMQIKLIFTRKVVYLASCWKWGFLELGGCVFRSSNNAGPSSLNINSHNWFPEPNLLNKSLEQSNTHLVASRTLIWILDPLGPKSDQSQFSPNIINT